MDSSKYTMCKTTGYFLTFISSLLKKEERGKEEWSNKTGLKISGSIPAY